MSEISIGHKGTLHLCIDDRKRNSDGTSDYLTVTADLDGLRAETEIYDVDGFWHLLSYFEELETNWRGWDGLKEFNSLEHDFRLSAKHVGHLRVFIELAAPDRLDPWAANGEFVLDPGEELTTAVEALRTLLGAR
ncbi:DUF6228 family protein [Paenarthrobacter ilicis]|uniref:Uncharacterized protein n=1 Tax=Paenarthrobacter ilicis TaxID=43665 RepID=A0ABX0TFC8_9MICC|nr:DUF6228 family protein [Paenarthrobacter ilicis]MBM7792276.1 hypothetical protein [Paenarthrobacter ilicis]NIJ00620.1 hypothetical protein [Paenarthrobacter ilicis]